MPAWFWSETTWAACVQNGMQIKDQKLTQIWQWRCRLVDSSFSQDLMTSLKWLSFPWPDDVKICVLLLIWMDIMSYVSSTESETSISGFESANRLKAFYFLRAVFFSSSFQGSFPFPLYPMVLVECWWPNRTTAKLCLMVIWWPQLPDYPLILSQAPGAKRFRSSLYLRANPETFILQISVPILPP